MAGAFQWPGDGDPRDFSVELEAAFAGTPLDALTAACRDADLVGGSLEPAERLAAALGLDAPLEDTDGAVSPADRIPSDDDWVRIATDLDPAIGAAAPDVVLGRWADGADRASLRAAV
ncbi:MAG: hypothetical protein ABMB14_40320, partial [Myxococcota bacterium]